MNILYNIYCDESCHLENDGINDMVLGAVWCPQAKLKEISTKIRELKIKHQVSLTAELKWTKIGPVKKGLYTELINYFFDCVDLYFRCLIVPNKQQLDHGRFNQTHDDWYYKMYFDMLKVIFDPNDRYEVYIDIKDTNSHVKAEKLREICGNNMYDFSGRIIQRIQPIRSNEVQIMQIVDILIGAVCYENRVFPEGFYHITCQDYRKDGDRVPDFRRCERIKWVRKFIENYKCNLQECKECEGVKIWEEDYHGNSRLHILLEEERYMVVVEKRERYCLLITAFYFDQEHTLKKKLKKYQKYKKQKAPHDSETPLGTPSTTGR